jgi:DNA uptake protein ComE-like DNA-binding protein
MYQLALPYFPDNEKLKHKMHILQERLRVKREKQQQETLGISQEQVLPRLPVTAINDMPAQEESKKKRSRTFKEFEEPSDDEYRLENDAASDQSFEDNDAGFRFKQKSRRAPRPKIRVFRDNDEDMVARPRAVSVGEQTPRTRHILKIINTRDLAQIRLLKGVGAKRAETIVDCLQLLEEEHKEDGGVLVSSLAELSRMKGVGTKTVENMRSGVVV